jgi:hypothetical protein
MMAKLYWRVKKNGKWTWVAAKQVTGFPSADGKRQYFSVREYLEEEE